MIAGILSFCILMSLILFMAWLLERKDIFLFIAAFLVGFAIYSILLYTTSKYDKPFEVSYQINIAPNNVAYICKDNEICNISRLVKQNLTEKDIYVEKRYLPYWHQYLYVGEKIETYIIPGN